MSDDSEPPSRLLPKRERVTLKWSSRPLRLPREDGKLPPGPEDAAEEDDSPLALPVLDGAVEDVRPSSIPPPGERADGVDGWERQRPKLTPPPFRAVRSAPPPRLDEDAGDALDLVNERSRPSGSVLELSDEMGDRYALGDYTAALRIAELILGRDENDPRALQTAESCRGRLGQLYGSRLGSLDGIPRVAVEESEVRWLGLDHRAAFLLSRVDGTQSLAEIVDVSGMPRLEALRVLVELLERGAIRLSR